MAPAAPPPGAAALLVALGVHLAAGVALLALGVPTRRMRWYLAFLALLTLWLAASAAALAGGAAGATGAVAEGWLSAVLPGAFALFALVSAADWPARRLAAAGAAALALAPLVAPPSRWFVEALVPWYHGALWAGGGLLLARTRPGAEGGDPAAGARRRRLRRALAVLTVVIAAAVALSGGRLAPLVVPAVASCAQGLVLYGAVRLQLYGVAQRAERTGAERTGALARDAAELDRLALLGELGATVAHEVRNPLTGIRSLAQRLAEGEEVGPERRARFAGLIVSEVDRLDRFVGSMLALARRDGAGAPPGGVPNGTSVAGAAAAAPATDVRALLDDVEALVAARAARQGARLEVEVAAPEVRQVRAPRGPLAQVLLNLVLNAVEHAPPGTAVRVRVEPAGGAARVTVRDHGPGLPPGAADALFTPFAPGARGTGLGLAVVRRVAEQHGWRVEAADAPGGGARFTLTLPGGAILPPAAAPA